MSLTLKVFKIFIAVEIDKENKDKQKKIAVTSDMGIICQLNVDSNVTGI